MSNFQQYSNNSNNSDIFNSPIFSPPSNEPSGFFQPQNEPSDDNFGFDYFSHNSDDNSLRWFQYHNNEINNFDNVNLPSQIIEPPNGNIPNEAMTTAAVTQMPVNPEVRVEEAIFKITKKKHKFIGRRRKDRIYTYDAGKTRFDEKNELTKIKKAAYNNYLDYTNESIRDSKDEEIRKRKIKLRKIDNSVMGVCSKDDNLKLIEMEMKDILSHPLSNNHTQFDKNYNKKAIDFILGRNDKKLISILNKDFEYVIRIYANDLVDKDFDGFKTIKDEVKKIKDKFKDDPALELEEMEYIKTYTELAKNYKGAYNDTNGRSTKKKKIN